MELVDIQRLVFAVISFLHPFLVMEGVGIQIPDNGSVGRTHIHAKAVGIAVIRIAVVMVDPVFVSIVQICVPDKDLIKFFIQDGPHGNFIAVDKNGDLLRMGSIDTEGGSVVGIVGSEPGIGVHDVTGKKAVYIHFSAS